MTETERPSLRDSLGLHEYDVLRTDYYNDRFPNWLSSYKKRQENQTFSDTSKFFNFFFLLKINLLVMRVSELPASLYNQAIDLLHY